MTNKRDRNKRVRIYRRFGVDWKTSHKIARRGIFYFADVNLNVCKVQSSLWEYCYSCDKDHNIKIVIDKHGNRHKFVDNVLWWG